MKAASGWPKVKLGDHVELHTGFPFKSHRFTSDPKDMALVKGENVAQGQIEWEISKRWPAHECAQFDRYRLRSGDVVLAMDRPWIEAGLKYAWIKPHDPCALLVQRVSRLRGQPTLDQTFLRYVIGSPAFTNYIKLIVTGVNVPHISPQQIKDFEFCLPPVEVQRRVATILSAYDDLIENNTQRIQILERMAQAIYREWFINFRFPGHEKVKLVDSPLGNIPQGWIPANVAAVSGYLNRGLAPAYAEDGGLVINQKCIRNGRINLALARRQTKPVPPEKLIRVGDVLINSTGEGTLGRVAQVYRAVDSCTVDSHVTIARPGSDVDSDFFGLTLLEWEPRFCSMGVGSTGQTELNRKAIGDTEITVPPTGLQAEFGRLVRPMRLLASTLQLKNAILRRTRDLLLPRLISGELDVSKLNIEDGGRN